MADARENKTLRALRDAMQRVNGMRESAMLVYTDNDGVAHAFVGDTEKMATAVQTLLDHVGEGRATPAEMAITRAILMAVAASDLRNNGQLTDVIRQNREMLLTQQEEIGNDISQGTCRT